MTSNVYVTINHGCGTPTLCTAHRTSKRKGMDVDCVKSMAVLVTFGHCRRELAPAELLVFSSDIFISASNSINMGLAAEAQ